MVKRVTRIFTREVRGLHEAAYLLAAFALLSQVLALVRDRLFAAQFGAGETLDIYYAAFRIPDLLFVTVASFISIYVLIPLLSEHLERNRDQVRAVLDSTFSVFFVLLALAGLLAWLLAPTLVPRLVPGFSAEATETTVLLTRIMLLQPILLGFSNLLASLTQLKGRFLLYAVSPLAYNLGIIFGVLVLYDLLGSAGLAWGVVLGAALHVVVQVPAIAADGLLPRPTLSPQLRVIRQVTLLSLPRTLTLSAQQLLLLVFVVLASGMAAGSIAGLQFAHNLQSVPLSIIGVSYSVAAFPTLARLFADGNAPAFRAQIASAMRHILFWSLPAIALIIVLRAQIVRVILGSGAFDWADTRLTAAALALFSISLLAQALVMLLVRGFYAAGDTRTPLLVNLTSVAAALVGALGLLSLFRSWEQGRIVFEELLRVDGIAGTDVLMLPLAFSLGSILNVLLLLALFERTHGHLERMLGRVLWQGGVAALAGGMASYIMLAFMDDLVDINTFLGIATQGFVAGVAGLAMTAYLLKLLGSRELTEAWRAFTHKFWRARSVVPEVEG